ncbi:hypothetical protein [Cytophaga sp. FL35]|uniref:hypothetical protein n=1 Tax=Cytophaga sp. FL35 TaxID=1904456 RepID=UPI00165359F5|nr:hypothetical protein [Cytophaga sp. FL35]MBC7000355.1 hypothetical protein [Cytophaga sp. FL35]
MERKTGRKPLGKNKRKHDIMLRFNDKELGMVKKILASYDLDFGKRGVTGPFLRRLILNKEVADERKLPDLSANLVYQINKIGVNINQLTTVARSKNLRTPSAKLEAEIKKANNLLMQIMELLNEKLEK